VLADFRQIRQKITLCAAPEGHFWKATFLPLRVNSTWALESHPGLKISDQTNIEHSTLNFEPRSRIGAHLQSWMFNVGRSEFVFKKA